MLPFERMQMWSTTMTKWIATCSDRYEFKCFGRPEIPSYTGPPQNSTCLAQETNYTGPLISFVIRFHFHICITHKLSLTLTLIENDWLWRFLRCKQRKLVLTCLPKLLPYWELRPPPWYPTQSHYPDTELTSPCPYSINGEHQTRKRQFINFYKSLSWLDRGSHLWVQIRWSPITGDVRSSPSANPFGQ